MSVFSADYFIREWRFTCSRPFFIRQIFSPFWTIAKGHISLPCIRQYVYKNKSVFKAEGFMVICSTSGFLCALIPNLYFIDFFYLVKGVGQWAKFIFHRFFFSTLGGSTGGKALPRLCLSRRRVDFLA